MKKILIAFALILINAISYAQTPYPINQTIGAPTTLVTSRGGFKADSSLILPSYLDTTKANLSPYGKSYAGALIRIGDSVYMRNITATKWINITQSGGGGGGNSWLIGGNTNPLPPYIGTQDEKELDFITFNSVRMRIPNNGIVRGSAGAKKYLLIDTTTKYLYYGDAGGGSGTVTSISQGYGITASPNPITTTGTLIVDTTTSGLSGKYLRLIDTANMLTPYLRGSGSNTRVAFWNSSRSLTYTSNITIDNTNPTLPSLQVSNGTSQRSTLNPTYSGTQYDANNYALTATSGSTPYFIINEGNTNKGSRLYSNKLSFYNLSNLAVLNINAPTISSNLNINIPDSSGTIALKEYTIDSLKRNPGTDSIFARKNGQWNFQYKDSIGGGSSNYIDTIYRTVGVDSIYYKKNGNTYAIKDSIGNFGGGGGGGKIYYFNGSVNMGTFGGITMYELGDTARTGAAANFTRSTTGNIANFITDVNQPGLLQIPAGVWTIDAFLSETGGGSNHAQIYAALEVWNGSTLTTVATSPVEEITNGSTPDLYTYSISVPTTPLLVTDRIVIQFYIQNTNGKTVTLYTQNGYIAEVHTTFTTGIGALNGLTAPSQTFAVGTSGTDFNISSVTSTHTFNLPTASATNRGALSSSNWTTFNSKIGPGDTATMLSPYLRKVDTVSLSDRINLKLNISDTANMLSKYLRKTDTASLSNRINLKLNISDTASMLSNYVQNVPTVAYLGSDFNTTNTTATNTNLTIAVAANTAYRIMISGTASKATSSTGMKISIGAPTGTTIKATASLGSNAISTIVNSYITSVNSLGSTFAIGVGVEVPFRVEGILVTGSTSGSITLQAATVTSNTATIYASTLMTLTKAYAQ